MACRARGRPPRAELRKPRRSTASSASYSSMATLSRATSAWRAGADVVEGDSTTSAPARHADVALLSVAIDEYDAQEAVERRGFLSSARGGRPRSLHAVGRTIELRYRGQTDRIVVAQVGPHRYRLEVDGELIDVDVEHLSPFESRIRLGEATFQIVSVFGPAGYLVEVDGVSHRITGDQSGFVRAPAPAVVVAVLVTAGA